ncbi:MAG: hypothetical protein RL664_967 [Bacteroidota bacterium]
MHYVYIIFSNSAQKFYVGETQNIDSNAFTSQANDWTIEATIACENRTQALLVENHIKSMKSKVYLENLIKYTEMREKLISRFKK